MRDEAHGGRECSSGGNSQRRNIRSRTRGATMSIDVSFDRAHGILSYEHVASRPNENTSTIILRQRGVAAVVLVTGGAASFLVKALGIACDDPSRH